MAFAPPFVSTPGDPGRDAVQGRIARAATRRALQRNLERSLGAADDGDDAPGSEPRSSSRPAPRHRRAMNRGPRGPRDDSEPPEALETTRSPAPRPFHQKERLRIQPNGCDSSGCQFCFRLLLLSRCRQNCFCLLLLSRCRQ